MTMGDECSENVLNFGSSSSGTSKSSVIDLKTPIDNIESLYERNREYLLLKKILCDENLVVGILRGTVECEQEVEGTLDLSTLGQLTSDDDNDLSCGGWCEYVLVVVLSSLLLVSSLVLVLFWTLYYREGFAWNENPQKQFNLHPVLMIAGFIFFSGFSMLLYRISRCCRRIYVKLLHTVFHALAIPCIVLGFMAVLDHHNLSDPPIPNFYSIHSWLGLVTMGLFGLQFVVGFFSFLLLLCCDNSTAGFRASLVPLHATFGLTTFVLAVATALTGLTEAAFIKFGEEYATFPEEGIVINSLALVLVAAVILVFYTLNRADYSLWSQEAIVINALAMVLVALLILISYAVRRETLRVKPLSYLSERL